MYKIKRFAAKGESVSDKINDAVALTGATTVGLTGLGVAGYGSKLSKSAKEFRSRADKMKVLGNVAAAKGDIPTARNLIKSANMADFAADELVKSAKRHKIAGAAIAAGSALGYGAKKLYDKRKKSKGE